MDAFFPPHLSPRMPRTREARIRTKQKRLVRNAFKYKIYNDRIENDRIVILIKLILYFIYKK